MAFRLQVSYEREAFEDFRKEFTGPDTRAALEQRFLDFAHDEMNMLLMTDDEQRDLARRIVQRAFQTARDNHRSPWRVFRLQIRRERETLRKMVREFEDRIASENTPGAPKGPIRNADEKHPMVTRFLELARAEMDALYMPDHERQGLARDAVTAVRSRAERDGIPLEQAFRQQLETERQALRQLASEVDEMMKDAPPLPTPAAETSAGGDRMKRRLAAADLLVEAEKLEKSGDTDGAVDLINQARVMSRDIDDSTGLGRAHLAMARLERRRGDPLMARTVYRRALRVYRTLQYPQHTGGIEQELGDLLAEVGEVAEARKHWLEALDLYKAAGWGDREEARELRRRLRD